MTEANTEYWRGRPVCVTGGTGFLGWQIVKQLTALGADTRVLALEPDSRHPIHDERRVRTFYGDIRHPSLLRNALRGVDTVFHTAGSVGTSGAVLDGMMDLHDWGTHRVMESADPNAAVLHTSSIVAVGSGTRRSALTEDHPFDLGGLRVDYVQAKRASERTALRAAETGRRVVVVNPGYLVGPEDWSGSVMGKFCTRFWRGRMCLVPGGGFNFVDVRDVAKGHLLAAERGVSGRRYILGGENTTLRQFARMLCVAGRLRPRAVAAIPGWALWLAAAIKEKRARRAGKVPYPSYQDARMSRRYWYVDSGRASRELGWTARPIRESLAEAYDWHQGQTAFSLRSLSRWWLRPAA